MRSCRQRCKIDPDCPAAREARRLLDVEAEFTRMPDEGKSRYTLLVVAPLLPFRARWGCQGPICS